MQTNHHSDCLKLLITLKPPYDLLGQKGVFGLIDRSVDGLLQELLATITS